MQRWRRVLRFLTLVFAVSFVAAAQADWVDAGPIHNNPDAQNKCPAACGQRGWDGNWQTKGFTSYCSCRSGGDVQQQGFVPQGQAASCSAAPTKGCKGCSVSCPAGQQASCSMGQDTSGDNPMCWTEPKCSCSGGSGARPQQPPSFVPQGQPTTCSAPATKGCRSCSVSCPAGKQASCSAGQDTSGTNPMCWTEPKCECR